MSDQTSKTPVRFPSGVTNTLDTGKNRLAHGFGGPDPRRYIQYFNDFTTYAAGDFTKTDVGTSPTAALTDAAGGALLLTAPNDNPGSTFLQVTKKCFYPAVGYRMWFEAKFQVSNVATVDAVIGLQITDTTPLLVSDGMYFLMTTGAATVDFIVESSNTLTTNSAIATLTAATDVRLGFYYNGVDEVQYHVNGVQVGHSAVTNLPTSAGLAPSFGLKSNSANSRTMQIDYIWAAQERFNVSNKS
jgi:hypothetical protein